MGLDANLPPELLAILRNMSSEPVIIGAADGDYQIQNGEGIILVAPPAAGTTTITLPGVMAAKGQSILIWSDGNATGTVTVEEQGDGRRAFADVILTADKDFVLVKNIGGMFWIDEEKVVT